MEKPELLSFSEELDYGELVSVTEDYCHMPIDTVHIDGLLSLKQRIMLLQTQLVISIVTHRKEVARYAYQYKKHLNERKKHYMGQGKSGVQAKALAEVDADFYKHKETLHTTYMENYDQLHWDCKEKFNALTQHISYLKEEKNRTMPGRPNNVTDG